MNQEIIIQGWHIIGFVMSFMLGGLAVAAIFSAVIAKLRNQQDEDKKTG